MTDTPTATDKAKKKVSKTKRPLTTAEKRARTRRRNTVKRKAGSKGAATSKTTVKAVDALATALNALSDQELVNVQKAIEKMVDARKAVAKIYKTAYARK